MSRIDDVMRQIEADDQEPSVTSTPEMPQAALEQEWSRQFRLSRIQIKDWGTYHGLLTLNVPEKGQLFVGHSGSGKLNRPGFRGGSTL
ncbi:ATP-binding protein [Pelomonas aquatica]|uniref:Uncharacterized protein n=1 Tax=Pelomonas aquatica TaxID=431058 RepID=A0A9X4LKM6_9BURK|nr:ATP-binding protein [Pelomonas aquatica]MCY4754907.1 hypothetical protein [Pelomonas aquatica]MDG0865385.1 hypothetical protein [Pelomonas aquatica]